MLCILFDNRVKLMLALLHNTPRQLSSSVINCCLPLFEHREPSVDEPPLFEGWRFPFVPVPVLLNLSYLKTILSLSKITTRSHHHEKCNRKFFTISTKYYSIYHHRCIVHRWLSIKYPVLCWLISLAYDYTTQSYASSHRVIASRLNRGVCQSKIVTTGKRCTMTIISVGWSKDRRLFKIDARFDRTSNGRPRFRWSSLPSPPSRKFSKS